LGGGTSAGKQEYMGSPKGSAGELERKKLLKKTAIPIKNLNTAEAILTNKSRVKTEMDGMSAGC